MRKISYLLIIFVSVFALMLVSADAGRGGHGLGGGYRGYYEGGGYAPGYTWWANGK